MRRSTGSTFAVACLAALFAGSVSAAAILMPDDDEDDLVPTGKGWGERGVKSNGKGVGNAQPAAGKAKTNAMSYHGGPVMTDPTTNVYYIWYGNWSGNTATTILTDLAGTIGGTPYYNINTTYYSGTTTKSYVKNSVTYAGATSDPAYSLGKALSDSQIRSAVSTAITSGALPKDPKAVYFVLTSSDVNATSGFCTQYCGWHSHASIGGADIKYAFVGNPDRCPNACSVQTVGPNGNAGADGMASIIAHELVEAVTDPDLNAWYDRNGEENADKCAWTFGTMGTTNGAKYNVTFGARKFLIQQNWINVANAGKCALSYP
jgi:hypothetical protein